MARPRRLKPSCRVCGCTEDRACEGGCWWVKVERGSRPLCSACSGTTGDLAETIKRAALALKPGRFHARYAARVANLILVAASRRAKERANAA